jgi:hypothetical protein
MHQPVIHLPSKVPEPDFLLDSGVILAVFQRPMGRPSAICGREWFVLLDLYAQSEIIGKPGLAGTGIADQEDLGVGVLDICFGLVNGDGYAIDMCCRV